jgi:virulence factor Mce-like protein
MRRLAAIAGLALAAVVLAAWPHGASSEDQVQVDALFDSAAFLVTGEDVRVGGAKVGTITGLSLTEDRLARVSMEIDSRWAPFRADADCTIQPQSLLGDRFVQCTPGTPQAPPLEAAGGEPPTVPVANTHSPVDLDVVLSTFGQPTRERLAVILASLGAGLAGHGEDLTELIRRSNPALGETARLLGIVRSERNTAARLVAETDRVLAALARSEDRIGAFVQEGAGALEPAAREAERLQAAIARLPALLDEVEPSLDRVTQIARDGTPLVRDLGAAADPLDRLLDDLPRFGERGRDALVALGAAGRRGLPALASLEPQVDRLDRLATPIRTTGSGLARLLTDLRERGVYELIMRFLHNGASTTSRFDQTSHQASALVIFDTLCTPVTTVPLPGCDARWAAAREADPARALRERRSDRPDAERRGRDPRGPARGGDAGDPASGQPEAPADQTTPSPQSPEPAATIQPQPPANGLDDLGDGVRDLLEFLLG